MKKAIVQIGWNKYVLDTDRALTVLGILESAEMYESKWKEEKDGGTTLHIYEQEESNKVTTLQLLPDNLYRMAKLAGRPE